MEYDRFLKLEVDINILKPAAKLGALLGQQQSMCLAQFLQFGVQVLKLGLQRLDLSPAVLQDNAFGRVGFGLQRRQNIQQPIVTRLEIFTTSSIKVNSISTAYSSSLSRTRNPQSHTQLDCLPL